MSVKEYRYLCGFLVLRMVKMKYFKLCVMVAVTIFVFSGPSLAHFGMVIPSDNMVMQDDKKRIEIHLSFSHPFEMAGMPLEKPNKFFAVKNGVKSNLKKKLKKIKIMGNRAWKAKYHVKRPGAYTFIMEPVPYWEPAEDCYIIHYTKTVIAAFGDDEGWEREVALKTCPERIPSEICTYFSCHFSNFTHKTAPSSVSFSWFSCIIFLSDVFKAANPHHPAAGAA